MNSLNTLQEKLFLQKLTADVTLLNEQELFAFLKPRIVDIQRTQKAGQHRYVVYAFVTQSIYVEEMEETLDIGNLIFFRLNVGQPYTDYFEIIEIVRSTIT